MQNLLERISLEGIIKAGEVYVFTPSDDRLDEIEGPDVSYTIRSDEELLTALEMEVFRILPRWYNLKEIIGWYRISDDCYEFRLSCIPKDSEIEKEHSLYLHRMRHVSERLEWVKRYWGREDVDDPGDSNYE